MLKLEWIPIFSILSLCVGFSNNISTVSTKVYISNPDYDYWCVGECKKDGSSDPKAGIILMGGGTDVDDAFKEHISMAGNGADFLIIRASGTDAYNDYVYGLASGSLNSVSTILLKNKRASSNQFVVDKTQHAEAIFFAGGNQWTYINEWRGSPLQDALSLLIGKNVPIGGTSAGCAILGEFVYTAANDTVYSNEALADPYNFRVTIGQKFLPFRWLKDFITDTHFVTRDRMGRLAVFVARLIEDGWDSTPYGIGIDEKTAVVIGSDGRATTYGKSTAYVIHGSKKSSSDFVCKKSTPVSFNNIAVQKLDGRKRDTFDFYTLEGGTSYQFDIEKGKVQGNPY